MAGPEAWERHWRSPGVVDYGDQDPLSVAIFEALVDILGTVRGRRICEAGSGSGKISLWLAQAGAKVCLVDFTAAALDLSRRAFAERGLAGEFVQRDVRDLPVPEVLFDLTWNAGVLEHLEPADQASILCAMARVTRPGGWLATATLLGRADPVLTTTPGLAADASRLARRVTQLPNAADPAHFAPGCRSQRGRPPCIGYVGVLAPHLDYPLLSDLIRARPGWRWVFIGQEKGEVPLPQGPPVSRRGHIPYTDLPAALAAIDVGVVPFRDNALTRAVDPVKVYEYLAAGKQVVATRLPHLQARDWPIRPASTLAEWLDRIEPAESHGAFSPSG